MEPDNEKEYNDFKLHTQYYADDYIRNDDQEEKQKPTLRKVSKIKFVYEVFKTTFKYLILGKNSWE